MQICAIFETYLIIILGVKIINKINILHRDISIENFQENMETKLHTVKHFQFAELGGRKLSDTTNSV